MTYLTKSRYIAGLQCLRRLWLSANAPRDYTAPEPGSPQAVGQEVGVRAHHLFPGGVLVDEAPWAHAAAVARTRSLMADPSVPAIFEAAFEVDGIRIRVDVLERLAGGLWGLREVKSSGGVKETYIDDVALQAHALEAAGVHLGSLEVLHIDTSYVRGGGDISWEHFFARIDVRERVLERMAEVPMHVAEQCACLALDAEPAVEPGKHCWTPHECEFEERCTAHKPWDWIVRLPLLRDNRLAELQARGVEAIREIPDDFPLSAQQAIIRNVVVSGEPYVSSDLAEMLRPFEPPCLYLDFEAMQPAIPLYAGTRPFEVLAFQWSLHRLDAEGCLSHQEFLADGADDPRRAFAESLVAALSDSDLPIIVYSPYERSRLVELARRFPDLAPAITGIIVRLQDLLVVVRKGLYHPAFNFSNSIKAVGPALCPGFGYGDLEVVTNGGAASSAFQRIASGSLGPAETQMLRQALLVYCERDTLAMVEVHRALMRFAD